MQGFVAAPVSSPDRGMGEVELIKKFPISIITAQFFFGKFEVRRVLFVLRGAWIGLEKQLAFNRP
ncbi:MAG: hypothetical protein EAZ60_24585 [Oscillatoriales cyanobacterium]|nr:MAG: hypothetical protein EAZ83_21185 [Oscillatoriales cyanobacterium]TAE98012.1 MAG: hypothetical protein EAZ79_09025 [Oscillatoriales cyanobacterium]TAF17081.1 MAG: hypothetical protein EAZ73_22555 [Oscillatoriales cyanobacterium]TAF34807.1 MAG: hypothetical protein EAZ69_14140 [Oscillatoriales cyanobacterium]TAF51929.1 MAG: hypothetical protein EAZ60_24585 [Oscillatoriales cyanobacterium]